MIKAKKKAATKKTVSKKKKAKVVTKKKKVAKKATKKITQIPQPSNGTPLKKSAEPVLIPSLQLNDSFEHRLSNEDAVDLKNKVNAYLDNRTLFQKFLNFFGLGN